MSSTGGTLSAERSGRRRSMSLGRGTSLPSPSTRSRVTSNVGVAARPRGQQRPLQQAHGSLYRLSHHQLAPRLPFPCVDSSRPRRDRFRHGRAGQVDQLPFPEGQAHREGTRTGFGRSAVNSRCVYLLSANSRIHRAAAPRLQVMRNAMRRRSRLEPTRAPASTLAVPPAVQPPLRLCDGARRVIECRRKQGNLLPSLSGPASWIAAARAVIETSFTRRSQDLLQYPGTRATTPSSTRSVLCV